MSTQQVEILFICGSPRARSSEALLALVEQGVREAGARSRKFLLSKKHLAFCTGCGSCEKTGACILAEEGSPQKVADDYLELMEALSYADALAIVTPVYFAGPPAQLKALYDRMQPYWVRQYLLGEKSQVKRSSQLFILGGGGDHHGYEPLVAISKSALAVAGFYVDKVQNFIGFKHPKDVAPLPSDEQAAELSFNELTRMRKALALQQEFERRAIAAGSAFARFVAKQQLGAEKQAEQAEATSAQDADAPLAEEVEDGAQKPDEKLAAEQSGAPLKVINRVDSDFEALKQAARASKSKSKSPELDAVMEEAVANLSETDETDGASGTEDDENTGPLEE